MFVIYVAHMSKKQLSNYEDFDTTTATNAELQSQARLLIVHRREDDAASARMYAIAGIAAGAGFAAILSGDIWFVIIGVITMVAAGAAAHIGSRMRVEEYRVAQDIAIECINRELSRRGL